MGADTGALPGELGAQLQEFEQLARDRRDLQAEAEQLFRFLDRLHLQGVPVPIWLDGAEINRRAAVSVKRLDS